MPANTGGLSALRRIQLAKEVTPGTTIAATAKLMGFTMGHNLGSRNIMHPTEDRGNLAESFRSFTPSFKWTDTLKANASFEDILYVLRMAIVGGVTPTVTETTAETWVYAPSLTSANQPDTCTLEFGDDAQAYQTGFVVATDLTISGQMDQALTVEANVVGHDLAAVTFTPALADRTIEDAVATNTSIFMDPTGGTLGTTQKTGSLLDFQWKLPKHFVPAFRQDGKQDFVSVKETKMAPTLELTIETPLAASLRAAYTSETRQLVRLQTTGTLAGTTKKKSIIIDGAYKIVKLDKLEDKDGADVVKMSLLAEYDPAASLLFSCTVINKLATLA